VTPDRRGLQRVPRGVVVLGLVSLCMDLSSETIHALLPVFLVSTLGASALTLGWIEGVAEATASVAKLFSGVLSDAWGRRKPLVAVGYALAAATKPLFPLATAPAHVFAARFVDRVGKGLRGAPRDALIADLTPAASRGASYGLRQALDTLGAVGGPLLAVGLMAASAGDVRFVFWVAAIPALAAVLLVLVGVEDVAPEPGPRPLRAPIRAAELAALGGPFAALLVVAALGSLARFSEAFLLLRASDAGLSATLVPLTLVSMNVAYAASSYPVGALSDRLGRRALLGVGFGVLVAADLALALAPGVAAVFAGVALWGLHLGLTQGLFAALVADVAPPRVRGSAFGVFHLTTGAATLAASVLAGALWDGLGPDATFLAGAAAAGLAACAVALVRPSEPTSPGRPADQQVEP
jgi:MFS family permease